MFVYISILIFIKLLSIIKADEEIIYPNKNSIFNLKDETLPTYINNLGLYPFNYDWLHLDPTIYFLDDEIDYIDKADQYNGMNGFLTPTPSIRLFSIQGRFSNPIYATCQDTLLPLTTQLCGIKINCTIVSILRSEATNLCQVIDNKALTITTSAPSIFKQLPCANLLLNNYQMNPISIPICKLWIEPDNSYKCYDELGTTIRLSYGGDETKAFHPNCYKNFYIALLTNQWQYVDAPDFNEGYADGFITPFPSIRNDGASYFYAVSVYIVCDTISKIENYFDFFEVFQITVMRIIYSDAPELCNILNPSLANQSKTPTHLPSTNVIQSETPSSHPSSRSTSKPTLIPSRSVAKMSSSPSLVPSIVVVSSKPSSKIPTRVLSTRRPSSLRSLRPKKSLTRRPSRVPSKFITQSPSRYPSRLQSESPLPKKTETPSSVSLPPTNRPRNVLTIKPTNRRTIRPTKLNQS